MDQNLCCLQEKFIKDLFVSEGLGAVIDEASYGYARCSMEIEPRHCNALGIPMGGTFLPWRILRLPWLPIKREEMW